jgi:hypothetical protein
MAEERKLNSFQRLMEDEYEQRFTLPQMMEIEHRLQRRQETIKTTGDVIDLFLPKFFKAFVHLLGGSDSDAQSASPSPAERGGMSRSDTPKAPGQR